MWLKLSLVFNLLWVLNLYTQNQLPLANGNFETLNSDGSGFSYWSNVQNSGGIVNYSIETNNLISGSTKAQKSQIISLGASGWNVKTQSDYLFQVESGQTYTVRFWAKASGSNSAVMKVVFQASDVANSYQGNNITISQNWQQYTHSFTVSENSDINKLSFWYMNDGVTYYLDEVEVVIGNKISFNEAISYQTVDGFGAGIKRRTEHLYALEDSMRQQIESYAFEDLEANMIRFFVYHDLEDPNDNNNPFYLNTSALNWTRYDSNSNLSTTRYVAEALSNAFDLSYNGFDHIIGNCNSAPAWLKTNNSHTGGGTLVSGQENEFSEFLIAFLKGMTSRYGIDVTEISPTNEPDYQVSYESMNTPPTQLSSIIKNLNQRLTAENLDFVNIISPENFRVNSNDPNTSTSNYIANMFSDPEVVSSTDIVATHTYQSSVSSNDWNVLKTVSLGKDIWVTEAGNLHSPNFDMSDASYHIERIMDGFNYGGLTAYMFHLFYEQHEYQNEVSPGQNYGSSALVLWDSNLNIILPKRYHVFKHFANLVKKDYLRIHCNSFGDDLRVLAFKSPNGASIVLQLFAESNLSNFDIEIPIGTSSVEHYVTSNSSDQNFSLISTSDIDLQANFMEMSAASMSMHSIVFNIDTSLSSEADLANQGDFRIMAFPSPVKSRLELSFDKNHSREISIFQYNGSKVYTKKFQASNTLSIDVGFLASGLYILKSTNNQGQQLVKFVKQ
ncbi:MAG: T9SS type A sorting domain-containing protein [Bacteroidota bacterium]|nr:T9SS type A sorting domain-containing protein [Bacteroidota bacterium]